MQAPSVSAASASSDVLHISFNQDSSCFCCGSSHGFRVFNSDPFKETFCRGFQGDGGIGIVEMLFRCNILAIVGGGATPKYPPNKVMIWDDHQGKCIGELTFRSQVRAVRLRRDRIAVALEHKVLVYNFADLKLLHQIETLVNSAGLLAISSAADATVLACPGLHTGQVRVELYERKQTRFISAHTGPLVCLTLSLDGKRLATASAKGTLVRVWGTADGQLLQELRRGSEPATITSIALSKGCDWLAVSSEKGTVHVFSLSAAVRTDGGDGGEPIDEQLLTGGGGPGSAAGAVVGSPGTLALRQNPSSLLSMVKGYVPLPKYFVSEWSFAQFKLTPAQPAGGGGAQDAPPREEGRAIVGFVPTAQHTLVIVTAAGSYFKVGFDPQKGGQCVQHAFGTYARAEAA